MKLINFDLMANPFNWAIVLIMAIVGMTAIAMITKSAPVNGVSTDGQ